MTPTGVPAGTAPSGRHHPDNFSDPAQHGPAAKFVTEDCRNCHGANLDGQGTQIDPASLAWAPQGCNTHHNQFSGASANAWRTDCTFCHGDRSGVVDANKTGAPPRDLKSVGCTQSGNGCAPVVPDATMMSALAFKKHQIHLSASSTHTAYDCVTCHPAKPKDAMDAGHWIVSDDTPGVAEISFANGMNAGGSYGGAGSGTCTSSYCHGNGRGNNGTVSDTETSTGCNFCHSNNGLSGAHGEHLGGEVGATCYDCHGSTVNSSNQIANASLHIDRVKQTKFATSDMVFSNGQCTGTCHGETHSGRQW